MERYIMWADTNRFAATCPCCGMQGGAVLGITKKGWPYFTCRACSTKCFMNSPAALTFLRVSAPETLAALERAFHAARDQLSPAVGEKPLAVAVGG